MPTSGSLRVLPYGRARAAQDNSGCHGCGIRTEKKPDEFDRAFTSHPEPELLKLHDPEKFAAPLAIRATTRHHQALKSYGNYEPLAVPLFPRETSKPAVRTANAADQFRPAVMCSGRPSTKQRFFRQRGL